MKNKLLLVRPPIEIDAIYDTTRVSQPLGLMYIASHIRKSICDAGILDCLMDGIENRQLVNSEISNQELQRTKMDDFNSLSPEEFVKKYPTHDSNQKAKRNILRVGLNDDEILNRIAQEKPTHIGVAMMTTSGHKTVIDLVKKIKGAFGNITTLVGGAHATHGFEKVLLDAEGSIDYCVRGDGQSTMEEILSGKRPKTGIAHSSDGRIIDLGERERFDYSNFGLIDEQFLSHHNLPIPSIHTYNTDDRPYIDFMFSRGCQKSCEFCVVGSGGYRFTKSNENHVDEQLSVFAKLGYKEIVIQDDDLLRDKRYFLNILKLLKKHNLFWQDNGGVAFEDIDEEITSAILENGMCKALYIPINPRSRKITRASKLLKTEKHEVTLNLIRKLKDSGISVYTSCIFGNGNQSPADIQHEINSYKELLNDNIVDRVLSFAVSHLPGTQNHAHFSDLIIDKEDWQGYSIFVPHAKTRNMSYTDVQESLIRAHQEFNKIQTEMGSWGSAFPKLKR